MQESNTNSLVHLEYSVSNDEENLAFKEFQKKFVLKNNIIKTVIFGIIMALFIQQVYLEPSYTMGWIAIAVILAILFTVWYNPVKIRKTLMKSLKEIENDIYAFDLYEDHFSISTIYCEAQNEVTSLSEFEENQEENEPLEIKPREVFFNQISVDVTEIKEMFIIFLKKETFYILPKRVVSTAHAEIIRKTFSDNIGEDLKIKSR